SGIGLHPGVKGLPECGQGPLCEVLQTGCKSPPCGPCPHSGKPSIARPTRLPDSESHPLTQVPAGRSLPATIRMLTPDHSPRERTSLARYRAAILGCGGRGRAHAAGYVASPQAEIVGCADPVAENARTLAKAHPGAKVYEDYRALLKEQRPDVVSICTWPH